MQSSPALDCRCLELRSSFGSVSLCDRRAGIWSVRDSAIEARNADNMCWLQIALTRPNPASAPILELHLQ